MEEIDTVMFFKRDVRAVYEAFRMMYKITQIILRCERAPPSCNPKALASLQIQCFNCGHLLHVWKDENCKLEELTFKMFHESSSEFGVPTTLRNLKMSADDSKYKMAQK